MHPKLTKGALVGVAFCLDDFGGMVWEHQVTATAVNVDLIAQVTRRHGGALDVPARAAWPPRARPLGFTRFTGLPEHKIEWVVFVGVVRVVATLVGGGEKLGIAAEACHFAIGGLATHVEKDVAVALIGLAVADKPLNDGNHAHDFFGNFGEEIWGNEIHVAAVFDELIDFAFGEGVPCNVVTVGTLKQWIVNVSHILAVRDLTTLGAYVTDEDIKNEERMRMPNVSRIVGSDTTHVERQRSVGGNVKRGFVPAKRIKELHELVPYFSTMWLLSLYTIAFCLGIWLCYDGAEWAWKTRRNNVRIGIDISRLATAQKTGTERYTWEVLAELATHPGNDRYALYCRDVPADLPALPAHMHVRHIPMRRLWTHLRLAGELWRDPPQALFVPSHVLPWNVPFIRGMRVVTTVHDLGFLHFPAAHTTFQNAYLRLTTQWAARVADCVIAISEATAADFMAYTGIARERVRVIPHGVSSRFQPYAATPQPWARYLLYVGTLQPRKNLLRLIQAFAHADTHPETQLVIAGRVGWLSEPLAQEINRLGLTDRVHLVGYVADAELPGLLAQARGFVFPSLYEGFGMPVLEAMASGTPVVCSNTSALPKVAGDAAILVDPLDVAAIAAGITMLDSSDAVYADYRQRGLDRVKMYSWQRCAQATIAAVKGDA